MLDSHEALHQELSDRYELEDVLGEGGMGTVYLARDRKHDRQVAIKTVRPDLTTVGSVLMGVSASVCRLRRMIGAEHGLAQRLTAADRGCHGGGKDDVLTTYPLQ